MITTVVMFTSCASKLYQQESVKKQETYSKEFSFSHYNNVITEEEMNEDCEYLKFLITQAYINYETEKQE